MLKNKRTSRMATISWTSNVYEPTSISGHCIGPDYFHTRGAYSLIEKDAKSIRCSKSNKKVRSITFKDRLRHDGY